MHTIRLWHVETRSIAIEAPPGEVHAFLAEPQNLPRWAPGFAQAVRAQGHELIVSSHGEEVPMTLSSSPEYRTVDMLATTDLRLGLFARILPNGDGSECVLSVTFGEDTPPEAVAAQIAVVAEELEAIKSLNEVRAA